MLSDEEMKAIDELKEEINKPLEVPEDKFDTFILYNIESAKIILNLIEKQQKEIEELKSLNQEKTEALEEWINGERVSIHCVHKDKLKEVLETIKYASDTSSPDLINVKNELINIIEGR